MLHGGNVCDLHSFKAMERQREEDPWGLAATHSSLISKLETKTRWAAIFKLTAEVAP